MTLFFALYTIGDSTDPLIKPFKNNFIEMVGYLLFGTFHIANITIMINMLIAMMTKSFEDILVAFICIYYLINKVSYNINLSTL